MKQIIKDIYHVGDNECSVYMVDTKAGFDVTRMPKAQLDETYWKSQ